MKRYNTQIFPYSGGPSNQIMIPLTMNTTLTSSAMQLYDAWSFSIQVVFTGTPTGTFKLQCSVDPSEPTLGAAPLNPPNWSDITGSPYAVTAAGNYTWDVAQVGYNYVRLVYTDTSSGTSTAVITSCRFNGKAF